MRRLHFLVLLLVCAGLLAACGGSDEDESSSKDDLKAYLVGSQEALTPIRGSQRELGPVTRREALRREAVDRLNRVAASYRTASRDLSELEPPDDLRDKHDGAVKALASIARSNASLAKAIAEGGDPKSKLERPEGQAELRAWFEACERAAEEAGLEAEDLSP